MRLFPRGFSSEPALLYRCLTTLALIVFCSPAALSAQTAAPAQRVQQLTRELTAIGRARNASSNAELRRRHVGLLRERSELLYRLIADDASAAAALALPPDVAQTLRAALPEASDLIETSSTLESPVTIYVADNTTAKTSRTVFQIQDRRPERRQTGNGRMDVYFASRPPAGLKCGDVLHIRGVQIRDRIAATEATAHASAASGCTTTGDQKTAVILVNFPGVAPSAVTPAAASSIFFSSTQRSLDSYWRENSSNQMSASGNVFGPYTLDRAYSCAEPVDMWTAAIQAADSDLDFTAYTRYFVIFPNVPNCSFTGLGTVGCGLWTSPTRGSFTGSVAWEPALTMNTQDGGVSLSAHEGGHGLGLAHSRSKTFSGEALGAPGDSGTELEYGDPYASMAQSPGHYAAPHKALLGWLSPETGYRTVETSGVFTIAPLETTTGTTTALKVRRGTGNDAWLWIEYRQPLGPSDSLLQGLSFSGAVVHYEDSTTLNYTDILDFSPQTADISDAPLSSWSDPYSDLSILALSATPSGLTLEIDYGVQSGCSLVIPSVSLSTGAQAAPPNGTIDYDLTVKNNDTLACQSPRTFTLTSPQPLGWGSVVPSTVTLAPQQSTTVTLTKSVPAAAPTGVQTVIAFAADANNSGSATATVIVAGPNNPQPVSVTPSSGSGNPVVFTFVFSDPDGYGQILSASVLFNTSVSFVNACHVLIEPGNNRFFLADDGETQYLGPVVFGSFQTIENSQCRISGAGSSSLGSGAQLTVNLAIAFKTTYLGATNIFMKAQNYFTDTGWQQMGSWTATTPQLPDIPSSPSPNPGDAGVPTNATLSWTPALGATWYDVYFGTSPSPPFAASTTAFTFSPGSLSSGTTYYWRVVANNAAGAASSATWSFSTVTQPDFSLAVTPPSQSVQPGNTATYTATVAALGGFAGNVTLSVSGLPDGAAASFSPSSLPGAGTASLAITTSSGTPPGHYPITVSATSGALQHSASAMLLVGAAATLTLSSSVVSPVYGQPLSLIATLSPPAASGAVAFSDGTAPLGTATISGGTATIAVSSLTAGAHQINAAYSGDSAYLPTTSTLSLTIAKSAPNVVLSSTSNPSLPGQSVTFTATVPTAATGTMQFLDATTALGTVTVSAGSATLAVPALSAGDHAISAVYSGDSNYNAATSATLTQTVLSPIRVTAAPNPATDAQTVTFTAVVSPASATGLVQFFEGTGILGTLSLNGGSATLSLSPDIYAFSPGAHFIHAVYSGDANNPVAISPDVTLTIVSRAATTVSLTSSLNPSKYGRPVTFTARVSPSAATGTVTFVDGSTPIGTALVTGGTASVTVSTLSLDTHAIVGVYNGDAYYAPSASAPLSQTVSKGTLSETLASSLNPSGTGQLVTFTATLSPASGTGTVSFVDGARVLATVPVTGGSAVFSTSALAAGSHLISAIYSGDADFNPTAATLAQSVKLATTTSLTVSRTSITYGQAVAFTGTVSGSATGSVQFMDGTASLGSGVLNRGTATLNVTALSAGSHSITAVYGGDSSNAPSTSNPTTVTVNQAVPVIAISSSPNPSLVGAAVKFTATAPAAASGVVTFKAGNSVLGTASLSSGTASLTTSNLAAGTYSVTANYGGDANYVSATSAALSQKVNKASSTVALVSSANPSTFGQDVTFTASVSPASATGSVQFFDGAQLLGTVGLSGGTAAWTLKPSRGDHYIKAVYGGDAAFLTSTSSTMKQHVN